MIEQLINSRPLEYTRAQLEQMAKERGIPGYYSLPENELLQRLRTPGEQILDRDTDARMVNVPFLTPTSYVPPQTTPTPSPPSDAVGDCINYLDNVKEILKSVSPKLKKLREKIEGIYKQLKYRIRTAVKSALKGFSKLFIINGMEGEGERSFFRDIHQNITRVLRNNRGKKVKMVFRCNMKRMSYSGRDIQPAAFHSTIEINLD